MIWLGQKISIDGVVHEVYHLGEVMVQLKNLSSGRTTQRSAVELEKILADPDRWTREKCLLCGDPREECDCR